MSVFDILDTNGFDRTVCEKFEKYYNLLIDWNEKINLTAITEPAEVATKHFMDSVKAFETEDLLKLAGAKDLKEMFDGKAVIDVGTGAGFPGLPLKICADKCRVTLLDSLNKRINFLNEVVGELELDGVECVHSRAEELGKNKKYRERYDFCVSRAVANLCTLSELCLPFVKVGGYFVSLKGPKGEQEAKEAQNAIKKLGGELVGLFTYNVPQSDLSHNIVVIKKISATSGQFPRKAPKPSKEPLI